MTYRQHIHKLLMTSDATPQAMQWGQRSFEIDFKILVIFVDIHFEKVAKSAKLKRAFDWGSMRTSSVALGGGGGLPGVCRGPNKGPSGIRWGPLGSIGGILGSIRGSLGVYPLEVY